jgi:hypothetical protein
MPNTTNYNWVTPADTDLVKDGAAAIRTLGSSVDTTTKALNPSTTLGDIEYRSSTANTNTRLGIGTTGQVLSVSGGVPAWTTPAGGSTSYTLLNSGGTSLSGSTTTVSFTAQDTLFISIESASTDTTDAFCFLRFNGNTANNYEQVNYNITGALTTLENGSGLNASFRVFRLASTGYQTGFSYIHVFGAKSTSDKVFNFVGAGEPSGTGRSYVGMGRYTEAAAITSVSVINSSGTWDNGTIKIYGAN